MDAGFLDIDALRQWMLQHPGWLYLLVGAIAFVESFAIVGIVVPGVALLAAASFAAGATELPLAAVLGAAFVGAVLGDGVSFLIGWRYHEDIKRMWPFSRHPEWIDGGEDFFARFGVWSIVSGRFIGPIRPVIPLVAGMFSVPARLFYAVNIVSALAWAPVYVLPGYFVGASIDDPLDWRVWAVIISGGLALTAFFHWIHQRYLR
jgi:undecaprenyl-diphosphatase